MKTFALAFMLALTAIGGAVALRRQQRRSSCRLEARIDRVVLRLGSLVVILTVILAAIRYLPHS
jgi:hypothetical protein